MEIREFLNKFMKATENMSVEEREALLKMFQGVSHEIKGENCEKVDYNFGNECKEIPEKITERLAKLKENYLKQVPSITIHRAKALTKIAKENPGLPKAILRGKSFKYCCETAPLVIQEGELVVGSPNGAPRAGAFSPDIAWRWLETELETISKRPQDPFYISEVDKQTLKDEIFPFWAGQSVDEYCEQQFREAGLWELSGESFVSDCSYHAVNGGGDSNPGYDVILMNKGMLDVIKEANEKLETLDYANPEDIEKI